MADDYYKLLGVSRTASDDEIQKAYRKLARQYHPDLADDKKTAKEKFQKIQHAYDVLSDSKKRQLYDQLGPEFERAGGQNPFQSGSMPHGMDIDVEQLFRAGGGGGGHGFEDILKQVFGQGAARANSGRQGPFKAGPAPGRDIEQEITIPFGTSVTGGRHQISLQRSGGKVENLNVKIPPGIEHGKKIRLRGQGDRSQPGGAAGDLLVKVKVAAHPTFKRQGLNLLVELPVTLAEAALGAKIEIPTPHGTVNVTVPPGSSSGKLLRLKGMGVRLSNGNAGDLIAKLTIQLPNVMTSEQKDLVKQLQSSLQQDSPRNSMTW